MAELSPAAQAVLDATKVRFYEDQPSGATLARWILRALADHQHVTATDGPLDHWSPDDRTRRELRNLAEELEGHG
jgi:hypothetical protein